AAPADTIELGPLPPEEATPIAAALLGPGHEALAARVVREASGIPFLIVELARHLEESGADDGVGIHDLLRARLERLPPAERALLELATVAGEPVSRRVAASALGLAPEDVGRAARLLRTSQLLRAAASADRIEPYHDRI